MRSFTTILLTGLLGSSAAFTAQPLSRHPSVLSMTSETHMDKGYTVGSGMTEHEIPTLIDNLNQENFMESLEMLEPLLTNECVGDICDDYVGMLREKAQEIGKEIPPGYAASHH